MTTDWRARLLGAARLVPLVADQPPEHDDSARSIRQPDSSGALTFAAAEAPSSDVWVAGRITSAAAHPRLGIAAGVNYVWVVAGRPTRMAILPADGRHAAHWLHTTEHAHSARAAERPGLQLGGRIRVFGSDSSICVPMRRGGWLTSKGLDAALTAGDARVLLVRVGHRAAGPSPEHALSRA